MATAIDDGCRQVFVIGDRLSFSHNFLNSLFYYDHNFALPFFRNERPPVGEFNLGELALVKVTHIAVHGVVSGVLDVSLIVTIIVADLAVHRVSFAVSDDSQLAKWIKDTHLAVLRMSHSIFGVADLGIDSIEKLYITHKTDSHNPTFGSLIALCV